MRNLMISNLYFELAAYLKWMPSKTRKLICLGLSPKGYLTVIPHKGITTQGILIDKEPIIKYFLSKGYKQVPNKKEENPEKFEWKLTFIKNDN